LKETLEGIAENLFVQDPYLQSGGDMVRMGGLDYTIDPAQSLGNRISNIVDDEGTPIPKLPYNLNDFSCIVFNTWIIFHAFNRRMIYLFKVKMLLFA
jgi:hypothetical protein